jgi:hypothetical protein
VTTQKQKTQPAKVKKKPTKYSKLMAVAGKELAAKKKALVLAERALQKAKQRHEELIAEVARLDMLERSLKSYVEGTEPPTNIRYIYNYPQWIYTPSITVPNYSQPQWTYGTNLGAYSVTCQNSNLTSGIQSGLAGAAQSQYGAATTNMATAVHAGTGSWITVDLTTNEPNEEIALEHSA